MAIDSTLPQSADLAASAATAPRQPHTMHAATREQAKKTGQEFEAMFLTQMMQHMFEGTKSDGWFSGGQAEEMFRPMLLEQYGKLMSQHGNGIGISDAVARTLLRSQEVSAPEHRP